MKVFIGAAVAVFLTVAVLLSWLLRGATRSMRK